MEPSDEKLVSACRRGEEEAWQELVARYQRLIYAIPRRAGLDENLSSEVFQQVFTILVEKLDRIEQPSQIQAWLVTTAKRETWRLMNRERKGRLTSQAEDDDFASQTATLSDHAALSDAALLALEEQHIVRLALDELDERCRSLLTLLFYRDEPPSYSDIAATLGIKEGSIGPTRARCLQKMLRLLDKTGLTCIFSVLGVSVRWAEFSYLAAAGA